MSTTTDRAASPLPWTVVEHSWQESSVYDSTGEPVCRLRVNEDHVADDDTADAATALMNLDAALIVRAVNCHDELVKALENAANALDIRCAFGEADLCRAALAKATGAPQ